MFGKTRRRSKRSSSGTGNRPAAGWGASRLGPDGRIGRYAILEPLGQGAMGSIYLGNDPVIGRQVAIKVISVRNDLSEEQARQYRERFLREAQAAGGLIHPNIVSVHDIGQDTALGCPYIVMEYVKGWDLGKLIEARAPVPGRTAARIALQLASALAFPPHRGIVHRDVKPANILIGERGQVKIADFGVARLPGSDLTRTDQFVGSPAYMSPEQLKGGAVDGRADLFALGVILYQLLTGRLPFDGESVSEVLYRVATQPAPPPSALHSAVSPEFDAILERALRKDPADRYQNGEEMMQALIALVGRLPDPREDAPSIAARQAPQGEATTAGAVRPGRGAAPWWDLDNSWRLSSLALLLVLIYILVNWAFHALLQGPLGRDEAPPPAATAFVAPAPVVEDGLFPAGRCMAKSSARNDRGWSDMETWRRT